MTEAEWKLCTKPTPLLNHLGDEPSVRKLRLFGCACCRQMTLISKHVAIRPFLDTCEQSADSLVGRDEIEAALTALRSLRIPPGYQAPVSMAAQAMAQALSLITGRQAREVAWAARMAEADAVRTTELLAYESPQVAQAMDHAEIDEQERIQVALVHDIFGSPFHSATVNPTVLRWNDSTVVKIAQAIYEERRFEDLPILADALEDAGCDNEDILAHCRQPGEHVRGCWVVDLILGKE